jgi:hypothetical protein
MHERNEMKEYHAFSAICFGSISIATEIFASLKFPAQSVAMVPVKGPSFFLYSFLWGGKALVKVPYLDLLTLNLITDLPHVHCTHYIMYIELLPFTL